MPTKLIFDTDMGGGGCMDVDDVGTLCMLHALADQGEVELLGVVVNTLDPLTTATVDVLNHFYGRDNVPVGVYKGDNGAWGRHGYTDLLTSGWAHPNIDGVSNDDILDSVWLYRNLLASRCNGDCVIASVGNLANLAALLRSEGDENSPLSGAQLIAQKVSLISIMGGAYPASSGSGECNIASDYVAATYFAANIASITAVTAAAIATTGKTARVAALPTTQAALSTASFTTSRHATVATTKPAAQPASADSTAFAPASIADTLAAAKHATNCDQPSTRWRTTAQSVSGGIQW